MKRAAIFLALLVACDLWGGGADDGITTRARQVFGAMAKQQPEVSWIGAQDGAGLAWNESYRLMAYVSMYEATGDVELLQTAATRLDAVLAVRDDASAAWSSTRYTDGVPYAWIVHAGMICYPLARWAYVVRRDRGLHERFGERAERYLQAVRETVEAFEPSWRDGPADGEGYYWGDFLGKPLPLNQQNAMGRVLVALWLACGEEEYRHRAEALARYFRNRIRHEAEGYAWAYWPGGRGREDVSHAAINADFAFVCFRAGLVFTRKDMRGFSGALRRYLEEARAADERISVQIGRWAQLSFSDPALRRDLLEFMEPRWVRIKTTGLLTAAYLGMGGGRPPRDRPVR